MESSRLNLLASFAVSAILLFVMVNGFGRDRRDGYEDDASHLRDAMAQSVADTGMYGIGGVPKAAVQDVWWRWIGGKVTALSGQGSPHVYRIMSTVFAFGFVFMLIKVLTLQYPRHGAAPWIGGLLVVLSPPLVLWCVNGMSGPAAALLVLLSLVIHMSGSSEGRPLPLSAAACMAAATAIQIEFIAVWLALLVHGIVRSFVGRGKVSAVATVLHGLNGLLLAAIFLAPMMNWNMRVIEVPWPRSYDSAMALDRIAGGGAAAASVVDVVAASLGRSYQLWGGLGLGALWSVKLFALIGIGYWIIRSSGGSRDNYLAIALALLLTPLFHAILVPFIGWKGSTALYQGLLPIWLLAVVAGVAALQHALDPLLSRIIPAFTPHVRHIIVMCIFAVTPLFQGATENVAELKTDADAAAARADALDAAVANFVDLKPGAALLTDEPGRALGVWKGDVYDLTAELDAGFLYFLDDEPHGDLVEIARHVAGERGDAVALLIWDRKFWQPGLSGVCEDLNRADESRPFVCVQ